MTILNNFYEYKPRIDPHWGASVEYQIIFGKMDYIHAYAYLFTKEELSHVEKYFTDKLVSDDLSFRVFNKIRWGTRKTIGDKANGLFSITEYYHIDSSSKYFTISEQNKEMLELHLKAIEDKLNLLGIVINHEQSRKEAYVLWQMPASVVCQLDKEKKEDEQEIMALKAAYENIKGLI